MQTCTSMSRDPHSTGCRSGGRRRLAMYRTLVSCVILIAYDGKATTCMLPGTQHFVGFAGSRICRVGSHSLPVFRGFKITVFLLQ